MLWIRVDSDFDRHPKTLKLKRLLNNSYADAYPQRLWRWALIHAPAGDLSGFDVADIASAIGFDADPQTIIDAMIQAGFLDSEPLQIHNWTEHTGQYEVRSAQGRARKARYLERKRNAMERNGNAPVTRGNAPSIRGEERRERKIKPSSSSRTNGTPHHPDFDAFWNAYPRKVGKGAAIKAFAKLKPRPDLKTLLEAISTQRTSTAWAKDSGQFIPHPSTWLNQQRWLDEPEPQDVYNPGAF